MIPLLLLWAQALDPGEYSRGMQAAQSGKWEEARQEFLKGSRAFPHDKRFPIELAGIEYRERHLALARHYLHAALRIDPADTYANDFLGTLYFLESNYEAALKSWNRAGKPRIESIETIPPSPVRPVLLDRALAFAPGEILRRDQYLSTIEWIRGLDAFGRFRVELVARPQEKFDAVVRWTPSKPWVDAASGLRGILFQTVQYEAHNLRGDAISLGALYRWDAQKRRIFAELSAPLHDDPRTRYRIYSDARSETWNIGAPADFRLRRIQAGAALRLAPSGRFSWEVGARAAQRQFDGAVPFVSGFTAETSLSANYRLLNLAERGVTLDARTTLELARLFKNTGGIYSRTQAALVGHWKPSLHPKDELSAAVRFGRTLGSVPYDELFSLGRESDDSIELRGHSGIHEGKKGVAPIGTQYVVANFDWFREVWTKPPFTVDLGPLLDVGRMWHQVTGESSGRMLIDAGLQVRLRLPTGFSVALSYGRPIHGGSGGVFSAEMH